MERISLIEALAAVPDPRGRCGRRHPLTAILSLTTLAILAGMHSLEAIAQFGRDHGVPLAHALGFRRGKTPCKSALSVLFRRLDVSAFEGALRRWLQGRQPDSGPAVALDGKTLRGSADGEVPGVHLLTAFAPEAAVVLAQLRVDRKTNEHKAALQLLGILPLHGKVVTGDAMFTHRDVAQAIRHQGGDYVLMVKDNQSELKAQVIAALHDDGDFSPLSTVAEGGCRASGANPRQRTWATGDSATDEYDLPEPVSGLAAGRSGL